MKDRLDLLLEKYWEGESTLAEEQEMKALLARVEGYVQEKEFFQGMAAIKNMKPSDRVLIPKTKSLKNHGWFSNWMKIAATLILLAGFGFLFQQYQVQQQKEAQAQAYAEVMEAFGLIQQHLKKGEKEMEVMDDLKYLNAPHQLFNLNEMKNE